jgi:hypothetical protein
MIGWWLAQRQCNDDQRRNNSKQKGENRFKILHKSSVLMTTKINALFKL